MASQTGDRQQPQLKLLIMDNSPLSDLPAEVRNEIYRLIVASNNALTICPTHDDSLGEVPPTATQPAITMVSRQLRAESLGMFYHFNTFAINISGLSRGNTELEAVFDRETKQASRWLHQTDSENHNLVPKLKLIIDMPWEVGRKPEEWEWFLRRFEEHGYLKDRLKTTVHVVSGLVGLKRLFPTAQRWAAFQRRQRRETKKFFRGMGIKVKTATFRVMGEGA